MRASGVEKKRNVKLVLDDYPGFSLQPGKRFWRCRDLLLLQANFNTILCKLFCVKYPDLVHDDYLNHSFPSITVWSLLPQTFDYLWAFIILLILKVNMQRVLESRSHILPPAPRWPISTCPEIVATGKAKWASKPPDGPSDAENGTHHTAAWKVTWAVYVSPKSTEQNRGSKKGEDPQEHTVWAACTELDKTGLSGILSSESATSHLQANAGVSHGDHTFFK